MTGPVSDEALVEIAAKAIEHQCSPECYQQDLVDAREIVAAVRPVIEQQCADQIATEICRLGTLVSKDDDDPNVDYWVALGHAAYVARSHGGKDQKQ